MNRREGISFQEAVQEAMTEIDSAESDLPPTAVEVDIESDSDGTEQPVVESNEQDGLFDKMFVEKQDKEEKKPLSEDSLTFDVDGVQVTIAELKSGYMRQDNYTRKTQELAAFRKEHENAIVLWNSLQERPQETITALWKRVSQGQPPVEQAQPAPQDIEALVEQRVQERLASDPRLLEYQKDQALAWANAELDKISADNSVTLGEGDRLRVLERAQELNTEDLRYAFFTLDQERRAWEKAQSNAAANSSVSGLPTSDDAPIDTTPKKYGSVREALDDSLREAGLSRDTIFVT